MEKELHGLFNNLMRFTFPFDSKLHLIPENGIYVKFEKGEIYNGLDRIVRVGTDTGENNLKKRLTEHFITENKNRSIFRKNIGRAILNKEKNPYLRYWELDITSKANKEKNLKLIDLDFESNLEKEISKYIQTNFSFCVFNVETKEKRLFWESKIVATLAQGEVKPSENWLGNHSPKKKIKESGLWQVQGLKNEILSNEEFKQLKQLIT
ncbi:MAG: hypothetical protein IPP60_08725 [Sphingobacteriales bacterium]|nr:hypothetical protein [Sphingobacteriales bacterium]